MKFQNQFQWLRTSTLFFSLDSSIKRSAALFIICIAMLSNWANAQAPTITSISPASAEVGASVTITGSGFASSNNIVFFGSVKAIITSETSSQIEVIVPNSGLHKTITVNSNGLVVKSRTAFRITNSSIAGNTITGARFGNNISFTSLANSGAKDVIIAVADFDSDGKPDVVKGGSSNVSVHRNAISTNGATISTSSFATRQQFAINGSANSLVVEDIDGDGELDIITASSSAISILRNLSNSNGSISFAPKFDILQGSTSVRVADINLDGKLDIVCVSSNQIKIFINAGSQGNLSFLPVTNVSLSESSFNGIDLGDMNGDGKDDIVVTKRSVTDILINNSTTGTLNIASPVTLSVGHNYVTIVDLDNNGINDLFLYNRIVKNTNNGGILNLSDFTSYTNTSGTDGDDSGLSVSDFNGDGFPEVLSGTSWDKLWVYINAGSVASVTGSTISGRWYPRKDLYCGSCGSGVGVDIDGDKKVDVVASNNSRSEFVVTQNNMTPQPVITISGSLNAFSKCPSSASASQSVTVTGSNLIANISVAALTGYEYSLDNTSFTSTINIPQTGGTASSTLFIRMTASSTGSPSGNITLSSTNAANITISASGSVSSVPTAPTGVPGSRIGTGVVNLSATVAAGNTVDWYATNTSTSALLAGSLTFTTPSISQTTTYYALARNTTSGCVSSSRTAVTATINTFTCPTINRRNNGNGQANRCAGVDGTAMHASVVNTAYATVPTTQKTGDISFQYASAPAVIPVITKIWIEGAISNVQVGPPSLYDASTRRVEYCFYNSNLPNTGRYTLEFTNPQTGEVVGRCTYDGSSNVAATEPNNLSTLSVLSFTPTTAKSGETVTITGTDFTGATSVKIGGVEVRSFTVVNATTIIAVVAANATVDNNVSVTTAGGTASASGFTFSCATNALDFDGTDDYVEMGAPMPLSGSDNFTIEAWVKPAAIDGAYHGFFGGNASGGSWPPSMWVGPNGLLYALAGSSSVNHTMSIPGFFTANQWTHVAWVKNGANFIVYKNGVQAGTLTANTTLTYPSANFFLGRVDNYLNGALDEVRIWNVARTQQEISDNMGIDIAANVTGLVAYYNFNQGTAAGNNATITTLNNLTSNTALNGTLTNIAKTGSRSNFVSGSSPEIITQPAATLSVCGNVTTGNTLTVTAAGQQLTYQWYRNTTNSNTGGTVINGATAASYAVPTNTAGDYYYYVVVTDCSVNETSSVSAVTVIPASVSGTISGTASVCANQNATVSTSTSYLDGVTNATDGGNNRGQSFTTGVTPGALNNIKLTIWPVGTPYLVLREWVSDNYANAFDGAIIATSNTATNMPSTSNWENPSTFVFPTKPYLEANTKYVFQVMNGEPYVKIPGAYAAGAAYVSSNQSSVQDMQFSINLHGAVASTDFTLTGNTGTIQWQSSSDNSTWANIAGATSATYTHNEYVISGSNIVKYFRAVVTNSTCTPATTSTFSHTINPPSVAGTASTTTSAICSGTTASLTLTGATGSVQWQSSTDNTTWTNITNASTANYTTPVLTQTTYFRAAVTSGACTSINSNTITVTVTNPPVAATLTGTQAICVGATTQLSATGEGGALAFNGTNNFVSTANNISALNITGDITVETWIKVNQLPGDWVRIIGKGDASARTFGFWLSSGGRLLWQIYGAGAFDLLTSVSLEVGRWHHIAASRIGDVHTIYIDGVASGTLTQSVQPATNTLPLTLGYSGFHTYLNGVLDEVRVWNVGRTATQINTNKDIEIAPQSGLVAYYKMNQGTAGANNAGLTTVNDNSGNNYNGTLNNFTLTGNNSNWVSRTSAAPSGTWASSDASIATVSNSGLVTGIAAGTVSITFTIPGSGGCTDAVSTRAVTVTAAPQAGTLSGTQSICVGSNTTFTSTVTGGTWSSSTSSVATVNSAGVVTGVAAGTATITYTVVGSGGCADAIVTRTVTVSAAPVSGSIRGTQNVCIAGTTQFTAVAPGNGLDFDGNDDHATLPAGVYFDDNTYTIEGWVYIRSHANWHRLIDFGNGASNHNVLIALSRGTSGQPALHMYNGASVYQLNATPVLPLNQWVHIAAVRDNNNAYMYVDGVLIASANDVNVNTAAITRNNNFIGKSNWSDANSNVAMSDLRIWNVARSQSQIANNMNAELSQQSGLILNLKFNDGTPNENNTGVTTLTDESGSGTNATLRNFALTGNRSNFVSRTNTTVGTGTWTSSNTAVATVDANSGLVTGVAAGTATITYTVVGSGGCSNAVSTRTITVNPLPAIAYGSASYRFERTKAITAFQPTSTGAAVASYAITPTLPAGLSFNTTSGAISGTPTAVVAAATYTVTATSAAGCTSTASFTLATFNAVAPSGLTYNPASQTVRRGTAITNMVPTATGDPIETYTISPALPAGISINATTGIIGGTLTEQVTGSVTYTVTGANTGGTATATVTLIYNTAPTDIDINPSAVPENEATGTAVGTLSTTDVDQGDTHTYTLVSGTGSTDNASFTIDGNTLKTNAVFDFETKTSYSIRIRTTDAGGLSYEEVFTITVTDVDEDNDGDGVMDSKEREDGTDPFDGCSFKLASQTVATSSAWKAADCDNDGLTNQQELDRRTNPLVADTDGDGVIDGKEVSDNTDPLDQCSFVLASQTVATSSAWKAADCDNDGLTNQQELDRRTNPLVADTDGDGVIDGKEVSDNTDPLNQCSFVLASQTVEPSTAWKNADCDNDGLTNQQEKDLKTDPLVSDTDGDGVIDGKEVSDNTDPLNQCSLRLESQTLTPSNAWLNGDCNGDGIRNGQNLLISMYATAPQLQSDGSFNLKYIVRVQNLRPERVTISGIQKNLTNTFRLPTTFRVTGVRGTSTGHLLAAASYDGRTQLNVVSTGSGIGGYTLDSITVDVNVVPNGFSGSVQSTATLTGTGAFNFTLNTPSTDVTVTGGSFPAGGAPTPAVIPVVTYIIPDAFSPNRDGINDRFVVIRPFQSVISLQVFNRWGNVVYRNDNYNNEWDGRGMSQYGGGDLPEGTYFYLIRSREQSGEVKQFRGSIMLKR